MWLYFCHIQWFPYFFSSHFMVLVSQNAVLTSHVTVLLSHSAIPLFFFFSHFMVPSLYCAMWGWYQHHIWIYFCHIRWFPYFFLYLVVPSLHCIVQTSHVTILLSHFVVLLFFFLHLMVSFTHYAIPTPHVTVLLLHSVISLFFSHIWWYYPLIVQYQHHMYGTILTLRNINITYNCIFVIFGGSLFLFFSHI